MEITDREILGEDLRAPMTGQEGNEVWHYSLVSHTRPGDIVFHWHRTLYERPALVGWSTVLGPLQEARISWAPHVGAAHRLAEARPNWVMPLAGIHYLDSPILLSDLKSLLTEILDVREALELTQGKPSYFPFNRYGSEDIRATQAYLTKLPHSLVELLNSRHELELDAHKDAPDDVMSSTPNLRVGGQGFIRDTARKLAIEQHAVAMGVEHYRSLGATDIELLGKPYDIRLRLNGAEVHVEVKGSANEVTDVLVTKNEVEHARSFERTELIVVDAIEWQRNEDGEITTTGGRLRRWESWSPTEESLIPLSYSRSLPRLTHSYHPIEVSR